MCFLSMILMVTGVSAGSASGPVPGIKPLDTENTMQISAEDRCPVCAMKISEDTKFASAIQLKDGTTYYFCGTGCMIRSWMHPEIFLNTGKENLAMPVVKDYFSGEQRDARTMIWVAGSDVIGRMGPAIVPLKTGADADVFQSRHGGKTRFKLEEMTDEKWETMTGKKAAPKQ